MKTRCLLCEGRLRWVHLLTKQRFYFVFWFSITSTSLTQHTYLNWPFLCSVEKVEYKIHKTQKEVDCWEAGSEGKLPSIMTSTLRVLKPSSQDKSLLLEVTPARLQ